MVIQATPSNYWISPTALHFELNALENPDYIHANASGDASILVYVKDIIDYDNAHNYRKFPLSLSSTAFGSVDPKYIYVAIPRTLDNTIPSVVVFPSVAIDVYGKVIITNTDGSQSQGDQLGDEKYYYIFLQGIISASETASAVVNRTWTHNIDNGILSSDEASITGTDNGWWLYNAATDLVTFTKKIANAVIATLKIDTLTFGNGSIKSVADTAAYSETDNESVATPKFVSFFGNKTYLSKLNDDEAEGIINFKKGIKFNDKPVTDILTSTEDITASDTILLSIKKSLATFLRKDVADSTDFLQTFTKGIISLYIQSAGFSTGMLGSGFTLKIDENGDSYLEVDRGLFRKTATFYELLIQKIKSVGGQIILTPTQMHCIKVVEQTDSYRCYFKNSEDNRTIYNEFVVNDLARCQDFNLKTGANYYWRKVIAVGDDYIDLSKTDCDAGSGIPAAGDDIIQIGNSSDVTRQGSIVLSAFGEGSSYIKVYKGINSYNLTGKEKLTLSPDLVDITADKIKFSTGESVKDYIDKNVITPCGDYVYGTDYLKSSLVTFNNQIYLSLQDTADCPIVVLTDENGNPLVTETGAFITPTDADGNVTYNPSWKFYSSNEAVENDVAKFKRTTDASFQVLNNEVASKVSSTTFNALGEIVDEHSTAIEQFPDTISASITKSVESGGTVYNAIATSLTMTDEGISLFGKRLIFNGTAVFTGINDKIQSKAHTFTSQPTDAEAYNVGDIWLNATLGSFKNDILKCITAKVAGATFNIAHWALASKYTDDTKATDALNYRETFAKNLGYASLDDMETQATSPEKKTIIKNGLVNTDLLEAQEILTRALQTQTFDAEDATIENLKLLNVTVNGSSMSPFAENDGMFLQGKTDNIALFNDQSSSSYAGYNIPNDVSQNGRILTITNYKYTDAGTVKESIGPVLISLATTGYVYENGNGFTGVALHKGEYVKLLGYGNSTTFFGWIVISRGNINQSDISYGRSWKVLAQGKVTGTSSTVSIYARTYNNASNFTIVRNSIGYYTVTCPSYIKITNINEVLVMATGIGESYGDPVGTYSPIKVSVRNVSIVNGNLTIEFMVSDDATPNDGNFGFTITNMLDWVS